MRISRYARSMGAARAAQPTPTCIALRCSGGVTVPIATGRGIGHFTFTAADGDSISTELLGSGEVIFPQPGGPPTHIHVVEQNIITSGTGRFAGVTGSFTVERLVDVSANPDPFSPGPFPVAGSFHGTIITSQGAGD